jgi:hypothetical protein
MMVHTQTNNAHRYLANSAGVVFQYDGSLHLLITSEPSDKPSTGGGALSAPTSGVPKPTTALE